MATQTESIEAKAAEFRDKFSSIREEIGKVIVGQRDIVDEVLVRLLEESLDLLSDADGALRARVMGRLARELRFTAPWERLESLSQGGVDMARRVGDSAALAE